MRTRSFIGLILLVALLMVATIPVLLEPATAGVERLFVRAGWKVAEEERKLDAANDADQPVDATLMLKGHELQESGDLRDTATTTERASNQTGRLADGARRAGLPGMLEDQNAYSRPPVLAQDGVLLDITGCPVFAERDDVAAMFLDPEVEQKYADKAAAADNPDACTAAIEARVAADEADPQQLLPGDERQAAGSIRSDTDRMLMDLYRLDLFDTFFGGVDAAEQADAIRASLDAD